MGWGGLWASCSSPLRPKMQGDLAMPIRSGGGITGPCFFSSSFLVVKTGLSGFQKVCWAFQQQELLCLELSWGVFSCFLLHMPGERPLSGRETPITGPRRLQNCTWIYYFETWNFLPCLVLLFSVHFMHCPLILCEEAAWKGWGPSLTLLALHDPDPWVGGAPAAPACGAQQSPAHWDCLGRRLGLFCTPALRACVSSACILGLISVAQQVTEKKEFCFPRMVGKLCVEIPGCAMHFLSFYYDWY